MLALKLLFGTLATLIALVLLYVAMAFILPLITIRPKSDAGVTNRQFYLYGNGVHIDVIFRQLDLPDSLNCDLLLNDQAKYVAFGWGDRGFYLNTPTWAELKFSTAFNAMVLKSPSVMHITEHTEPGKDWRLVDVSEEQFQKMLKYVKSGFETDEDGDIIPIPDVGYTPQDRFFEGAGYYHCARTCNTWVNTGLKKSGLKVGIWATQQNGILRYYPERVVLG